MLSILNNISALTAQNQLSTTQSNLQKTLTQLSSGLKINSGADDAAGLSIANGLTANIAALTQSQQNASNGIGLLQTADGALSQVTALLNRAVTLATEASNSTLNGGTQNTALDTEFQKILSNINSIGQHTNFNGSTVFGNASISIAMSDGTGSGDMTISTGIAVLTSNGLGLGQGATYSSAVLTGTGAPANNDTITVGSTTYTFVTGALTQTTANQVKVGADLATSLKNLADAINGTTGSGTEYSKATNVNSEVSAANLDATSVTIQAKTAGVAGNLAVSQSGANPLKFANGATQLAGGTTATVNLLDTSHAATALSLLTTAISTVAGQRGDVGAAINQLQSASNIMNTEVQNLTAANNSVMNADIGKTVAEMTQFNILQSTGMSALQQANQSQQAVLKLLQ